MTDMSLDNNYTRNSQGTKAITENKKNGQIVYLFIPQNCTKCTYKRWQANNINKLYQQHCDKAKNVYLINVGYNYTRATVTAK